MDDDPLDLLKELLDEVKYQPTLHELLRFARLKQLINGCDDIETVRLIALMLAELAAIRLPGLKRMLES